MPSRTVLVPGARELEPMRQGSLDNLCGLYSIVNAIQLALYPVKPLGPTAVRNLFKAGIRELARRKLLDGVLEGGIAEEGWLLLRQAMLRAARVIAKVPINSAWIVPSNATVMDSRRALRTIRAQLKLGRPVLLVLWGDHSHATVAVGYTDTRLLLFDSAGRHWVQFSSCGLEHARTTKRHRISPASAMALMAG